MLFEFKGNHYILITLAQGEEEKAKKLLELQKTLVVGVE